MRAGYHDLHCLRRIAGRDALQVGQHVGTINVDGRAGVAAILAFVIVTAVRGATRRTARIDEHRTTADVVLLKPRAGKRGGYRSAVGAQGLPVQVRRDDVGARRNLAGVDGDRAGRNALDALAAQPDTGGDVVTGNKVVLEKAQGLMGLRGRCTEHHQGDSQKA